MIFCNYLSESTLRRIFASLTPFFVVLTFLGSFPCEAADLIISQGETTHISGGIAYDNVDIAGTLVLDADTNITVNGRFKLTGEIRSDNQEGLNGTDGADYGSSGTSGTNGEDGYNLYLTIYGDATFGTESRVESKIDLSGKDGGNGGSGADGEKCYVITNNTSYCGDYYPDPSAESYPCVCGDPGCECCYDCAACPGSQGGNGGNSGNGGNGGSLYIVFHGNVSGIMDADVNGGSGGNAAAPGTGGWSSDAVTCHKSSRSGSTVFAPGQSGESGDGGNGGTATIVWKPQQPSWTYSLWSKIHSSGGNGGNGISGTAYYDRRGVGSAGEPGGSGGNGGLVKILASCGDVDLYADIFGGDGGDVRISSLRKGHLQNGVSGGNGGNGGKSFVAAGVLDGRIEAYGGEGGEGEDLYYCGDNLAGNGGSGGNGGEISLQAGSSDIWTMYDEGTGGTAGEGGIDGGSQDGENGVPGTSETKIISPDDLAVILSVDQGSAPAGDLLKYELSVSNLLGQSGVLMGIFVPDNTTLMSASDNYIRSGNLLVWNIGELAPCLTEIRSMTVAINDGTASGTIIENTGLAASSIIIDPVPSNTVTTEVIDAAAPPDRVRIETQLGILKNVQYGPDPVHTGIGNYVFHRRLFSLPGKTMPFTLSVTYNSMAPETDSPLGFGWTHSYNIVLLKDTENEQISIQWGDGHKDFFTDEGGGFYTPVSCNTEVSLNDEGTGFKAVLPNGLEYIFNSSGLLTQVVDKNDNTISLAYSGSNLTTVTDQASRTISFSYDSGYLASISAPESIEFSFNIDDNGDLTKITDPRGNFWDFTYQDTTHLLDTLTDRRGIKVLTLTYDDQGRVHTQSNVDGGITTYAYDSSAGFCSITPPSGNTVFHAYDADYNQTAVQDGAGGQAAFTFDDNGKRLSAQDKLGQSISFSYDADGNLAGYTNRAGDSSSAVYNTHNRADTVTDYLGNQTSMSYDENGNLISLTDPLSGVFSLTYNNDGHPLTRSYPRGNTSKFAYNVEGLLQSITDPMDGITEFEYDEAGRVNKITYPSTKPSYREMIHDANGNMIKKIDRTGLITEYTFDENDNILTATTDPGGINAVSRYEYNSRGQLTTLTNAAGGKTRYTYDADGNIKTITDPDGVITTREYDSRNRLIRLVNASGKALSYDYDKNGNITSRTSVLGQTWQNDYDEKDRLIKETDPLGAQTSITYDALDHILSQTDKMGRTTYFDYDALGRITKITYPGSSTNIFKYDANGNRTELTDSNGNTWRFSYDQQDRLTSIKDPKGREKTMSYDAMGNIISRTFPGGDKITYDYDKADRLVSIAIPDGEDITFTYDDLGHLTHMTDSSGTTKMTYDNLGRQLSFTDTNDKTLYYSYTDAGRLKTLTYPGEKTISYAYNNLGQLTTMTDWNQGITRYNYDTAGKITKIELPNGTYTEYAYDAMGQLINLTHKKSQGDIILSYDFIRDKAGRIVSTDTTGEPDITSAPASMEYTYDAANQIIDGTQDGITLSYGFDHNGNRITRFNDTTTYYGYDLLNRLIAVDEDTHTTTYAYDGAHNRIRKIYDGEEVNYLRQGKMTYCTYDETGSVTRYFVHAGAMVYSLDEDGNRWIYHADTRGSVGAITDDSQNLLNSYTYGPYGKVMGASSSLENPYQFIGTYGVSHDENGLYHMHRRYYDPETGCFMNEDPLGLAAGLNLYDYVEGDPVNRTDPGGLTWGGELVRLVDYVSAKDEAVIMEGGEVEFYSSPLKNRWLKPSPLNPLEEVWAPPSTNPSFAKPHYPFYDVHAGNLPVELKPIEFDPTAEWADIDLSKPSTRIPWEEGEDYVYRPGMSGPLYTAELYATEGPTFYTVDRFTFWQRSLGIHLENALVRTLGSTGARVVVTGGTVAIWVGGSIIAAYEGWKFGRYMGTLVVWDSVSGTWMSFDQWVEDRLNEILNGDPEPLTYEDFKRIEDFNLRQFKDEMKRVWDMTT